METQKVKTTYGELEFYRDWDCDGAVRMINQKTIDTYKRIKEEHPNCDDYGVWFAFTDDSFKEGFDHALEIGKISADSKIVAERSVGLFGTEEGINGYFEFYKKRREVVKKECDPQEVYFYEYNNHESFISWDGDMNAYQMVEDYFGKDVAKKITRFNAYN